MSHIIVEELKQTPLEQQRLELVERKGSGHPDSMCDGIMEQISVSLCREYLTTFGQILHHNLDKGLLVAGRTQPRLRGGTVNDAMRLVFRDLATVEYRRKSTDIGAIAEESAKIWLKELLRLVDLDRHVVFQGELQKGSPELTDLFEREVIGAPWIFWQITEKAILKTQCIEP